VGDKTVLLMPGEVTGAQAQTIANAFGKRSSNGGRRRKKRTAKRTKSATARRTRRTKRKSRSRSRSGGSAKLVKGSAAARRHMAKLRAMRK